MKITTTPVHFQAADKEDLVERRVSEATFIRFHYQHGDAGLASGVHTELSNNIWSSVELTAEWDWQDEVWEDEDEETEV